LGIFDELEKFLGIKWEVFSGARIDFSKLFNQISECSHIMTFWRMIFEFWAHFSSVGAKYLNRLILTAGLTNE